MLRLAFGRAWPLAPGARGAIVPGHAVRGAGAPRPREKFDRGEPAARSRIHQGRRPREFRASLWPRLAAGTERRARAMARSHVCRPIASPRRSCRRPLERLVAEALPSGALRRALAERVQSGADVESRSGMRTPAI